MKNKMVKSWDPKDVFTDLGNAKKNKEARIKLVRDVEKVSRNIGKSGALGEITKSNMEDMIDYSMTGTAKYVSTANTSYTCQLCFESTDGAGLCPKCKEMREFIWEHRKKELEKVNSWDEVDDEQE